MFRGHATFPIVRVYRFQFVESLLLVPGSTTPGTRAHVEKALAEEVGHGAVGEIC